MCGIFGFSSLTNVTMEMAPILAYAMQDRGDDSWGATDGNTLIKELGPICDNFYWHREWEHQGPVIFHTRAASVGAVTQENAHPFIATATDGRTVIGIHNGHISNYQSLNNNHNRKCSVDSQHIFHHIAEGKDMTDISGWGAVAWFDSLNPGVLQFVRFNMQDLWIVKLASGEIAFCSTSKPLERAAGLAGTTITKNYAVKGEVVYRIEEVSEGGIGLVEGEPMLFGSRHASYPTVAHSYVATRSGQSGTSSKSAGGANTITTIPTRGVTLNQFSDTLRKNGMCVKCRDTQIDRSKRVLCKDCEMEAEDLFMTPSFRIFHHGEWIAPLTSIVSEVDDDVDLETVDLGEEEGMGTSALEANREEPSLVDMWLQVRGMQ